MTAESWRFVLGLVAFVLVTISVWCFFWAERAATEFFGTMGRGASGIRARLAWSKRGLTVMALTLFLAFLPVLPGPVRGWLVMATFVWMALSAWLNWRGWRLLRRGTRRMGKRWES